MSKIDWEQKLKCYHALKDKKSITNMLQIKTKNIRLSPSLVSTTRAGTERNSFRHKRLKTPMEDGILQIKTSRSQQEVSPLRDVCPWNTQTPLQKLMKIDKATEKEKKVLQQFICNKWLKEVILKKSIHVAIPKESEEEKRIRLQEFETSEHHRQLRIQQSLTPSMNKMEKVFCKIKIFCKLASQRGIPLSDQIRINNDYRRLVFFVHFRNEDYKICDQMINSDPHIKNAIDMQGDRPLHIAVRRNNLRQLTYILSKQPDLEAINFYEQTALNLAILLKHFEIQKVFL
ncbi:unnamed protein product (macronuclear) [Paramecium tetraurelia]|uniref:Uncharacterized protein n=2 Tax=Paramecium tetraurelia TaxID=5888 RepID=A0D5H8_PARTE|nr:uncharacterized protein GSPATT00039278001 [Paramecium tetraurelia]CAK78295.1 unnamed protein product [Paramecium tetraurelia]|eukprot:XP_001445692.1 hypothetical protein (macronuclear) [Paramecium tetraurelia strain d4-2]